MRVFCLCLFIFLSSLLLRAETESPSMQNFADGQNIFYELVSDNIRPDPDEFYVTSIYGRPENPRVLIKRSTNLRSSDLYTEAISFGIGDDLSPDLLIENIDLKEREVIIKKKSTGDFFSLKLSYGDGVSRLIPKSNYHAHQ